MRSDAITEDESTGGNTTSHFISVKKGTQLSFSIYSPDGASIEAILYPLIK